MSIKDTRDAIVEAIQTAVPSLREVAPYDGRVTREDLGRIVAKAPAAYVSCLGIEEVSDAEDDLLAMCQWVISLVLPRQVITERTQASRSDAATAVVETLIPVIRDSNSDAGAWADECNGPPDKLRAVNVFDVELDRRGMTIWLVTWSQQISLEPWSTAALDDLLRIDTNFSMGGNDTPDQPITTELEGAG